MQVEVKSAPSVEGPETPHLVATPGLPIASRQPAPAPTTLSASLAGIVDTARGRDAFAAASAALTEAAEADASFGFPLDSDSLSSKKPSTAAAQQAPTELSGASSAAASTAAPRSNAAGFNVASAFCEADAVALVTAVRQAVRDPQEGRGVSSLELRSEELRCAIKEAEAASAAVAAAVAAALSVASPQCALVPFEMNSVSGSESLSPPESPSVTRLGNQGLMASDAAASFDAAASLHAAASDWVITAAGSMAGEDFPAAPTGVSPRGASTTGSSSCCCSSAGSDGGDSPPYRGIGQAVPPGLVSRAGSGVGSEAWTLNPVPPVPRRFSGRYVHYRPSLRLSCIFLSLPSLFAKLVQ